MPKNRVLMTLLGLFGVSLFLRLGQQLVIVDEMLGAVLVPTATAAVTFDELDVWEQELKEREDVLAATVIATEVSLSQAKRHAATAQKVLAEAQQAEIDTKRIAAVYAAMPADKAGKAIAALPNDRAIELLNQMRPDIAARILAELDDDDALRLAAAMSEAKSEQ